MLSVWRRTLLCAMAMMALGGSLRAQAPGAPSPGNTPQELRDELDRLRREFEAIRDAYAQRLAALEARIGSTDPSAAAAPAAPPVVPVAAPAAQDPGPPPSSPAPAGGSKVFNPDIAVIGNFLGAVGKNDINPSPLFDMNEAEATFQAVVDPYARADFFLAFSPEGVEIEEGFVTFTSLPGGLLAKVGKMKEQVGKVNTLHPHALSWTDRPLALGNLLGGEEGLADAGVSVSKLLPNRFLFLEATGELFSGNSGIFQSHQRSDLSWVGRLRGYRDLTEATNLDVGASFARGKNDLGSDFSTEVVALDATFRYRPLQRALYRRFLGRTELFWSRRDQEEGTMPAFGMYVSGDYQFARRWFAGARYDWSERATDASLTDKGASMTLTFWPSEFSQLRGQYRRINFAEGVTSNEVLFQLLFSIGAHGAHVF